MTSVLFVGHSLVNTTMPGMVEQMLDAGHDASSVVHHQVINGAPLHWNWTNSHTAQGVDGRALLGSTAIDAVVLTEAVPLDNHLRWSDTVANALRFAELALSTNPNARVYIYETWHDVRSGTGVDVPYDDGDDVIWRQRLTQDAPKWQGIVDAMDAALPDTAAPVRVIPVGQALGRLADAIAAGEIPGLASITDLFADDIHLTATGNAFVAMVEYAVLTGTSPVGLSATFADAWGGIAVDIPPALAAALQASAWASVQDLAPWAIDDDVPTPIPVPSAVFGDDGDNGLVSTVAGDSLYGGDGDDTLAAGGGGARLWGGDGQDSLLGAAGADSLRGDHGHDRLFGGTGLDSLFGGAGDDLFEGGDGSDRLAGDDGRDTLVGGAGHDSMTGGTGDDLLQGGEGHDTLDGGTGNDTLEAGHGDDALRGGDGQDLLQGHAGQDSLFGGGGHDTLQGGSGQDSLGGGSGHDLLSGGTGHDTLLGDSGDDRLLGSDGDDALFGGTGHDALFGDAGRDLLVGGDGNDSLVGGEGDDTLWGGQGMDTLVGGSGADRFVWRTAAEMGTGSSSDVVVGFTRGVDALDVSAFLDPASLLWQGASSFTGRAGEVRFLAATGVVQFDLDGDRRVDARLVLEGATALGLDAFAMDGPS